MKGVTIFTLVVFGVSVTLHAQEPAFGAPAPAAQEPEYALRTEPWTWHNLFYGPFEILASPLVLIMGPVYGVNSAMEKLENGTYDLPDTIPNRMLYGTAGSVVGLSMGPALALKGVFDTLTGGYWADNFFESKTGRPTPGRFTADPNDPPLQQAR
jgi:hypothetical protein